MLMINIAIQSRLASDDHDLALYSPRTHFTHSDHMISIIIDHVQILSHCSNSFVSLSSHFFRCRREIRTEGEGEVRSFTRIWGVGECWSQASSKLIQTADVSGHTHLFRSPQLNGSGTSCLCNYKEGRRFQVKPADTAKGSSDDWQEP
jgi:hypothetical protein